MFRIDCNVLGGCDFNVEGLM